MAIFQVQYGQPRSKYIYSKVSQPHFNTLLTELGVCTGLLPCTGDKSIE